jgi:hypothetical protein
MTETKQSHSSIIKKMKSSVKYELDDLPVAPGFVAPRARGYRQTNTLQTLNVNMPRAPSKNPDAFTRNSDIKSSKKLPPMKK